MRRRALAGQLDQLKAERNEAAKADGRTIKEKGALPADVVAQRKRLGERIGALEAELRDVETVREAKALYVPTLPLPELPDGDASHNAVVCSWGAPAPPPGGGRPHWEIAERLGILDLRRGALLSGSGFPVFVGQGARLVRALVQLMLDLHTREHGYVEVEPPVLVRREMLQGTGQLPKFEEDAYKTTPDDLFLVPTAEVPLTNLHRDEILDGAKLPLAYTAYTPCFRREAGAHGKDTRGLLRVHQFDKVELVRFVRAADSPREHDLMTGHAETVLQRLELPYRVVLLAARDVWFPPVADSDLRRRAGPRAVVVLALLLGGITVGYMWVVARHLGDDARDTSRLLGRVFAGLNDPRPDAATDALLDLAAHVRGLGIPIAITDTAGRVTAMDNAPPQIGGPADTAGLRAWIARLDAVNAPLVQPGVGTIHYGPLPVAMRFTGLAALQGAVFLCLGWLAVWAYRQRLAATRDRLWAAMARESAHQLGTPLMSLTGWIAYLREHPGTTGGELVDHLQADTERLERVAKRFERIGCPVRQEPVAVGTVAGRVVSYFRPRLPTLASPVRLEVVATGPGPTALGDPVLIEWAVEALVKNAIDALSGRGGRIEVRVEAQDDIARVRVRDDGPGVPTAVRTQLFEPGVSTKPGGWGIGLALARRIVEQQHHGRIQYHPAATGGSEFVLEFPLVATP